MVKQKLFGGLVKLILIGALTGCTPSVNGTYTNNTSGNNTYSPVTIDDKESSVKHYEGREITKIKNLITECIDETSKDSLETISLQGGYFISLDNAIKYQETEVPIYYDKGKLLMPSKEKIEEELSESIQELLPYNLSRLDLSEVSLEIQSPKIKTSIKKGRVSFQVNLPLLVKQGEERTKIDLKKYKSKIISPLYSMIEIAEFVTDSHRENPDMICISELSDMADERGLIVNMYNLKNNEDTVLIEIAPLKEEDGNARIRTYNNGSPIITSSINKDRKGNYPWADKNHSVFRFINKYPPNEN